MKEGTGLLSFDGVELREGNRVEFVSGPYGPRKGQNAMQAEVVWNPRGMWSLKYGDEVNQYWIENPQRLRIIG